MTKGVILVGGGALAGVCLGYLLWIYGVGLIATTPTAGDSATGAADGAQTRRVAVETPSAQGHPAAQSDRDAVAERIAGLAVEPRSAERDAELHTLLARLSAHEPHSAVRLVQRLEAGDELLAVVFRAWFASSPDEALEALGGIPAGSAWLVAALELVDRLGNTGEAVERIASAIPFARAQALRVSATEALAQRDPPSAIAYAITLDPSVVRSAALQRAAEVIAISDPRVALDHTSLIPYGPQRTAYMERVLDIWASVDPGGVLNHLERSAVSEVALSAEALSTLASVDPERLLALVHRLPGDVRSGYEQTVIDALIASDPGSAYAYADALSPGRNRDRLLAMIVSSHSRLDAPAALSHAIAMHSPSGHVITQALVSVAAEDVLYAVDRTSQMIVAGQDQFYAYGAPVTLRLDTLFSAALERGSQDVSAAVDLIANHPDHRVRRQLTGVGLSEWGVLGMWAEHDSEGAIAWTIRNAADVNPLFIEHLGARATVGGRAPQQALYDLPAESRGYWVAGVAKGLAASSLDAALEWLEPTRGTPVYATTLESVLTYAASREPATVARAIDTLSEAPRPSLLLTVVREWGSREPTSAADWLVASENVDDGLRAQVIRDMVLHWSQRDLHGAETWARSLPGGAMRDSALGAVFREAAATSSVDVLLLADFSSDSARAEAIVESMDGFRRSDPDLGRLLIDQYISDPALRAAAEQRLEGRAPRAPIRVMDGLEIR